MAGKLGVKSRLQTGLSITRENVYQISHLAGRVPFDRKRPTFHPPRGGSIATIGETL
jgi:hypothetical protein